MKKRDKYNSRFKIDGKNETLYTNGDVWLDSKKRLCMTLWNNEGKTVINPTLKDMVELKLVLKINNIE